MKDICLLVLFPKAITKDFIKNEIHIRTIVLRMFIIEFLSLCVLLLKFSHLNFKLVLIGAVCFSLFGTYIVGGVDALILYILNKVIIKRISTYKTCFKLILPKIIIDAVLGIVAAIFGIIGIELPIEIKSVFGVLGFIYFIILLSYYLKQVYICRNAHIVFVDVVYSIFFVFPQIFNNLL